MANAETHREDRAATLGFADFDRAAMLVHYGLDDRQAEASAVAAGAVGAPEALKDSGAVDGRDAGPMVADGDAAIVPDLDGDGRSGRRVADGIFHQVAERTPHHFGMGVDFC